MQLESQETTSMDMPTPQDNHPLHDLDACRQGTYEITQETPAEILPSQDITTDPEIVLQGNRPKRCTQDQHAATEMTDVSMAETSKQSHVMVPQPNVPTTPPQTTSVFSRKQQGAGDCGLWASCMRLSDFHKSNCRFHWPKSECPQGHLPNSLLLNDKPIPLKGFEGNINNGEAKSCIVSVYKITKEEHGFDDTIVLKEIRCKKKEEKESVVKEAKILEDLNHNHIIAFLGAYIKTNVIGLLMFPVASYNLRTFMEPVSEHNEDPQKTPDDQLRAGTREHVHCGLLRRYFACLCQGLLYLHMEKKIKHKDIKPDNILIDRYDSIIITDFGVSTQHMGKGSAVTMGDTRYTVQYAAPEINNRQGRDWNIDIFSLGCVFLEMANVIYGETFQTMYNFLRKPAPGHEAGQDRVNYFDCPKDVRNWVTKLREKEGSWTFVCHEIQDLDLNQQDAGPLRNINDRIFDMILKMMSTDPKERPEIREVWELFDGVAPHCSDCHPNLFHPKRALSRRMRESVSRTTGSSNNLTLASNIVVEDLSDEHIGDKMQTEAGASEGVSSVHFGENSNEPLVSETAHAGIAEVGMTEVPVTRRGGSPPPPRSPKFMSQDFLSPSYRPRSPSLPPSIKNNGLVQVPDTKTNGIISSDLITLSGQDNPDVSYQPTSTPDSSETPDDPPIKRMVRVFSLGREPAIENKDDDEIEDMILISESGLSIRLINWRKANEDLSRGVLMHVPRRGGRDWRCVRGDVNLWRVMSLRLNIRRMFGGLRTMFFKGTFPDKHLLRMVQKKEKESNGPIKHRARRKRTKWNRVK